MIEVAGLRFRFPSAGASLFENLSLSVHTGRHTALTGPSGIGKTTFLQILAGLLPFQGGTVRVAGVDLGRAGDAERGRLRNRELGFIFQDYHLLEDLTVAENLELRLSIAGIRADSARIGQCLDRVGLADLGAARAASLSGGQKQRLAAARALITSPRWILADEPTGNLDDESAGFLTELLFSDSSDATVLAATHDPRVMDKVHKCIAFKNLLKSPRAAS